MPGFKKSGADKFERPQDSTSPSTSNIAKDTKTFIDKMVGDISKTSATKQLIIGASTGWLTGCLAMKVGKAVACAVGGGIILLEVAHAKGYIKINWDKLNKQMDKVSDQVEEKITGQGPPLIDKMERYVERKMDKAEELLKERRKKAGQWYSDILSGGSGSSNGRLKEIHIFLISFVAGVAVGVVTS